MSELTKIVQQQYLKWPYPKPLDDIAAWQATGGYTQCETALDHELLWPERDYNPEMSILIAGCGTNEAALQAYNHPHATVVGIDLSSTSLENTERLKNKHGLQNLELRQMDLHNVAELGRKFDLVSSYGVVHCTPDPTKALTALSNVVADDGVIFLALYGKYLRYGVYMVQDALRRLGISQSTDDVAFAKSIVASLPLWHPVQAYMRTVDDLGYDSGFVDTFLHRQDIPYAVPDVLALADSCNLNFQGWFDNLFYYPDGAFYSNQPLYRKISSLPMREQWATVELLAPPFSGHRFMMRKKACDIATYRIDCEAEDFLDTFPNRRQFLKSRKLKSTTIELSREWHQMQLNGLEVELFLSADGKTNVKDIISKNTKSRPDIQVEALNFFKHMFKLGHLTFSKVPCK
jgi:SAM-dependent methyltransferase